jgi:ATP-dependent RNA helicase RhlE
VSFEQFNFTPQIMAGITAAGYTTPTPIQSQAIAPLLEGRDLLGLAQTGTGKTAAFALPILQRLQNGPRGKLRVLVLSPTRELAEQTHTTFKQLGKQTGFRSLTIYGGVSAVPQVKCLRVGLEIVVACPGRLLDLYNQKALSLKSIEMLVIDEADRMFDMGFLPDIRRILAALPSPRQTMLFSATMPPEIRGLADEMLRNPVVVDVGSSRPLETISHAIYAVEAERKTELLMRLLPQAGNGQVLVFTRTKSRAKRLAQSLEKSGLAATSLQGNLSQNRRQEAMDDFRRGKVKVLVATDIAARGIDVRQISHVINFDMPDTADAYTHRIGRTGRMADEGTALTLVTQSDVAMLRTIERTLGYDIERRQVAGFEYELSTPIFPARGVSSRTSSRTSSRPSAPSTPRSYTRNGIAPSRRRSYIPGR